MYQACRTSSFAVQKASRAQRPAPSAARSWRTVILQNGDANLLQLWLLPVEMRQVRPCSSVFTEKLMQLFVLNFLEHCLIVIIPYDFIFNYPFGL